MGNDVEKIVRILRRCYEGGLCGGCDYKDEAYYIGSCNIMSKAADMIECLSAELEQVKRERDAAVYDLSLNANCAVCGNYSKCAEWMSARCAEFIDAGNASPFFDWRGVCKENGGGAV